MATVKRTFDILLSLFGLIVLSPVLLVIALWIRLGSRGPVLYRGLRAGRNNKPFHMMKFRTMIVDADRAGPSSTAEDDPRITRAGKFLRRYKLDELPQLINVLLGEMSFVGPRPQVQWAVDLYTNTERELLSVRPGITDYASLVFRNEGELLRGSEDPDKDYLEKIAPEKIKLGLLYVQSNTIWIDIKIILATAGAILGKDPACVTDSLGRSKRE
jgi:lipopolysaccharide/colanic/teichoic acid biosynthesis glycosyltransferase